MFAMLADTIHPARCGIASSVEPGTHLEYDEVNKVIGSVGAGFMPARIDY